MGIIKSRFEVDGYVAIYDNAMPVDAHALDEQHGNGIDKHGIMFVEEPFAHAPGSETLWKGDTAPTTQEIIDAYQATAETFPRFVSTSEAEKSDERDAYVIAELTPDIKVIEKRTVLGMYALRDRTIPLTMPPKGL